MRTCFCYQSDCLPCTTAGMREAGELIVSEQPCPVYYVDFYNKRLLLKREAVKAA